MSEDDVIKLKMKLRHTCEKYSDIKVPYKYHRTIDTLRQNNSIVVLKQDKGIRVVILGKNIYVEKCLSILDTNQFMKLDKNPTSSYESKIQRMLRKIKSKFSTEEYKKLYPTGSIAGRFYGTAKLHKIDRNDKVNKLPLHSIVSNIGTASYQLAKYFAKLLSPLSKSEYTVQSSTEFMEHLKIKTVPRGYHLVSFDVISLFTNVLLDACLKRIYDNKEINTTINKREMKELIKLCTKDVHFNFNGTAHVQKDGVAMLAPSLAPVLAGILMVELERAVIPKLSQHLQFWKRYEDDTICFVRNGYQEFVLSYLNSFHNPIQFTYETEKENEISFLDTLIIRSGRKIEARVYRKSTNTDIYIHWNSYALSSWKRSTLKTLIMRAYTISSDDSYFKLELKHLRKVFHKRNGYPQWFITKVMNEVKRSNIPREHFQGINENENGVTSKRTLILPYAGEKGCSIVSSPEKQLKRSLPNNVKPNIGFTGTKLSSNFNVKDPVPFSEKHDVIYIPVCETERCNEGYVGECTRRLCERVKDHKGRDHSSHLVKHVVETGHLPVDTANFEVIGSGYRDNARRRKIAEVLLVKKLKPTLNIQEKSVPLKLFN